MGAFSSDSRTVPSPKAEPSGRVPRFRGFIIGSTSDFPALPWRPLLFAEHWRGLFQLSAWRGKRGGRPAVSCGRLRPSVDLVADRGLDPGPHAGRPRKPGAMVQMETQLQSIFEEVVVSERARDPGLRLGEGDTWGSRLWNPTGTTSPPFLLCCDTTV